jgi:hypothetical protein
MRRRCRRAFMGRRCRVPPPPYWRPVSLGQLTPESVVLLLRISGLNFQRHAFADEIAQHGEVLAFLFQKQIHNIL